MSNSNVVAGTKLKCTAIGRGNWKFRVGHVYTVCATSVNTPHPQYEVGADSGTSLWLDRDLTYHGFVFEEVSGVTTEDFKVGDSVAEVLDKLRVAQQLLAGDTPLQYRAHGEWYDINNGTHVSIGTIQAYDFRFKPIEPPVLATIEINGITVAAPCTPRVGKYAYSVDITGQKVWKRRVTGANKGCNLWYTEEDAKAVLKAICSQFPS